MTTNFHLEDKERCSCSLLEELQEVRHHHLCAVHPVSFLCSPQLRFLLISSPRLEISHRLIHGKGHGQEELPVPVKNVADLLELEGQDVSGFFVLTNKYINKKYDAKLRSYIFSAFNAKSAEPSSTLLSLNIKQTE